MYKKWNVYVENYSSYRVRSLMFSTLTNITKWYFDLLVSEGVLSSFQELDSTIGK